VLTVIDCPKIAGANSPIFKIAGAKAPIAPVLNRPLIGSSLQPFLLESVIGWHKTRLKIVSVFALT
jgi:hypothetical protein